MGEGMGLLWAVPVVGGLMGLASWVRGRDTGKIREYLEGFPAPEFLPPPTATPSLPGRWGVRTFLMVLSGLLLTLAWVGLPLGTHQVPIQMSPRPVVLIFDISRSMAVQDVPFGRFNSARLLTRRVVSRLPGNPVALLAAAGEAHQLLPPTHDRDLLFRYLDALDPGFVTDQGTSLSGALEGGRVLVEEARLLEPVFLLVSDGEDHGEPSELRSVVRRIREEGGQVSAISVGSEEGGVVPPWPVVGRSLMSERPQADTENGIPYSRARPDLLKEVAEVGGGIFARGEDPSAMSSFLREAEDWGGVGGDVVWETRPRQGWSWFVGLAVGVLVLELLLGSIPSATGSHAAQTGP